MCSDEVFNVLTSTHSDIFLYYHLHNLADDILKAWSNGFQTTYITSWLIFITFYTFTVISYINIIQAQSPLYSLHWKTDCLNMAHSRKDPGYEVGPTALKRYNFFPAIRTILLQKFINGQKVSTCLLTMHHSCKTDKYTYPNAINVTIVQSALFN